MTNTATPSVSDLPSPSHWFTRSPSLRLGQSSGLDEVGPGRLPALIVAAVLATVVAFIAWAAVMPIAEVTPASGEVLPAAGSDHRPVVVTLGLR